MISLVNVSAPIVAALTMLATTYAGFDAAKELLTPPIIEGRATRVSPVMAGEKVLIEWYITKLTDCDGVAGRVWYGEAGFYVVEPLKQTTLPMNKSEMVYRIPTQIPILAPSGGLDLFIKGHYNCPNGLVYYTLGPVKLTVEDPT